MTYVLSILDEIAALREAELNVIRKLEKFIEESKKEVSEVVANTINDEVQAKEDVVKEETISKNDKPETVTIEQVRTVMAKKSQAGKTADVKELLERFKARKLSEVDPKDYKELLEAAKTL